METPAIDKGVRKFRAMVIGLFFVLVGYVLAGWRGWADLFETFCWAVFGMVTTFTVPNVAEKIWARFPKKTKPGASRP